MIYAVSRIEHFYGGDSFLFLQRILWVVCLFDGILLFSRLFGCCLFIVLHLYIKIVRFCERKNVMTMNVFKLKRLFSYWAEQSPWFLRIFPWWCNTVCCCHSLLFWCNCMFQCDTCKLHDPPLAAANYIYCMLMLIIICSLFLFTKRTWHSTTARFFEEFIESNMWNLRL